MLKWSSLLLATVLASGCVAQTAVAPRTPHFENGADVSALAVMERHGAKYADKQGEADGISVLRRNGVDCFRLRLFVQPKHEDMVTNDLPYTLALAKRVKDSGARFMLDIHYSDTWADPAKQYKPEAWKNFPFEKLEAAVREYSMVILDCFVKQGLTPDYVQVGNEITNGMLWPEGKAEYGTPGDQEGWERLARLLRAGVEGVRLGSRGAVQPKIILHIESTGNVPRTQWWLDNAMRRGVDFDIIGLSYYPEWHGTVADLSATLQAVVEKTERPVMVVEVAYPWKPDEHWEGRPNMEEPFTPAGQAAFLKRVRSAVEAVPQGLGAGLFYWHPESIQHWGVNAWLGGSCALFDDQGNLLPGAAALTGRE